MKAKDASVHWVPRYSKYDPDAGSICVGRNDRHHRENRHQRHHGGNRERDPTAA
jgi:hypothetical protein